MVTEVSKFAYRLVLALIVLHVNSSSEARSTARSVEETLKVIRIHTSATPSPSPQPKVSPICQPEILNPAINCACYAYSKLHLEDTERKFIEALCKEPYFDNENGYASCSSTNFTKSGQFSFAEMNQFFVDLRENCAYPETPYAEDDARFVAEKAIWKGREETEISGLGEYSHGSPLTRIPRELTCKTLSDFCLTLSWIRGTNRRRAYRYCATCLSPSPRQTPSPSPESRICQPQILNPAVRCGCSGYSPYYLDELTFGNVTQLCRDELDNDIQSGMASCPYTNFTKSEESEDFDYAVMNQYFYDARESCAYPGTGPSSPASSEDRIPKQFLRRLICNFCLVLGYKRGFSRRRAYSKCC